MDLPTPLPSHQTCALLGDLSSDALKLVCQYLSFEDITTLYATHSRHLCRKLISPGVVPIATISPQFLPYENEYLRAHTGLQNLILRPFVGGKTVSVRLPCRFKDGMMSRSDIGRPVTFLAALSPKSLTSLVVNVPGYVDKRKNEKLMQHFEHATFQSLFPGLKGLQLCDLSLKSTNTSNSVLQKLMERLPSGLESLSLCAAYGWPTMDALPITLKTLMISDPLVIKAYSTDEKKPIESMIRELAKVLPNLSRLGLLLPSADSPPSPIEKRSTTVTISPPLGGFKSTFVAHHPAPVNRPRTDPNRNPLCGTYPTFLDTDEDEADPQTTSNAGHGRPFGSTKAAPSFGASSASNQSSFGAASSFGAPSSSFTFGGPAAASRPTSAPKFNVPSPVTEPPQKSRMDEDSVALFPKLEFLDLDVLGPFSELSRVLSLCPTVTSLRLAVCPFELGASHAPMIYPPGLTSLEIERRADANEMVLLAPNVLQDLPNSVTSLHLTDVKFEFGETFNLWGGHSRTAEPHPEMEGKHWQSLLPPHLTDLYVSGFGIDLLQLPPHLERLEQSYYNSFSERSALDLSFCSDFSRLPRSLTELISANLTLASEHIRYLPSSLTYLKVPTSDEWHQEHVLELHQHLPSCRINLSSPIQIHAPFGSSQHIALFGESEHRAEPLVDLNLSKVMEEFSRPFRSHIANLWSLSDHIVPTYSNPSGSGGGPRGPQLLYGFGGPGIFGLRPSSHQKSKPMPYLNLPSTVTRWNITNSKWMEHDMKHLDSQLLTMTRSLRELIHQSSSFEFRFGFRDTLMPQTIEQLNALTVLDLADMDLSGRNPVLPRSLTVLRRNYQNARNLSHGSLPWSARILPPGMKVFAMDRTFAPPTHDSPVSEFPRSLTEFTFYATNWTDVQVSMLKDHLVNLERGQLGGKVVATGQLLVPHWKGPFSPQLFLRGVIDSLKPFQIDTIEANASVLSHLPETLYELNLELDATVKPSDSVSNWTIPNRVTPWTLRRFNEQYPSEPKMSGFEFNVWQDPHNWKCRFGWDIQSPDIAFHSLPASLTSLRWLTSDCTPAMFEWIRQETCPSLTHLALNIPGPKVYNPFHQFPRTLTELILYAESPIHCTEAGLAQFPRSLKLLHCDRLTFLPSMISSFPIHIVDLHFNGANGWADVQIVALAQHIGLDRLVKLRVDDAAVSGAFIPKNETEVSETLLRKWTNEALGSQYECKWSTVAGPLVLSDTIASLCLDQTWITAIPRFFNHFPSLLTSLHLNLEREIEPIDLQNLPTTVREISLLLQPQVISELGEWFWSLLPRSLTSLSISRHNNSKKKADSSRYAGGPPRSQPPLPRLPQQIAHPLFDVPASLKVLNIPQILISINCLPHLPSSLQQICAQSNAPQNLRSLILERLPNVRVDLKAYEANENGVAMESKSMPHPNFNIGRYSFD